MSQAFLLPSTDFPVFLLKLLCFHTQKCFKCEWTIENFIQFSALFCFSLYLQGKIYYTVIQNMIDDGHDAVIILIKANGRS